MRSSMFVVAMITAACGPTHETKPQPWSPPEPLPTPPAPPAHDAPLEVPRDLAAGSNGDPSWGVVRSLESRDGRVYVLADGANGSVVRLLDSNLRETARAAAPAGIGGYGLAVSPDGRSVAVGRSDGVIWMLDADGLTNDRTLTMTGALTPLPGAGNLSVDPFGEVRGVGYTSAGRLVSMRERGAICFEEPQICYDAMPSIKGVVRPGRVATFAVTGDRAVFAWRSSKLAALRPGIQPVLFGREHGLPDNLANALAASITGWIAIAYKDDSFELLRPGRKITLRSRDASSIAFSANGAYLAVGARETITRYDLRCLATTSSDIPASRVTTFSATGAITSAIVVTDRGQVITGNPDGRIVVTEPDRSASDAPNCAGSSAP